MGKAGRQLLRRISELVIDAVLNIETRDILPRREKSHYEPSRWLALRRLLPKGEVTGRDVFVDFGCGKGRVLHQATRYSFGAILGIEKDPGLAEIARRNMSTLRAEDSQRVRIVTGDAREVALPAVTVAYFFNPFRGLTFEAVVNRLVTSVDADPRRLTILYANPREEQVLLDAGFVVTRRTRRAAAYQLVPDSRRSDP